jgi:hypothetical protein
VRLGNFQGARDFRARASRLLGSTILHLFLIGAVLTSVLALELREERRVSGSVGFTMDDSWIHAAIARNLVEGDGFAINKGESLAISTSPAWTLLEALFFAVLRNPVTAGLTLSYICAFLAAWLVYLLAGGISGSRSTGLLAAVLLAGTLVFYCHVGEPDSGKRMIDLPAALAFAAMTRPEFFVLIPLALADTARQLWFDSGAEGRRPVWRVLGVQSLVLSAALAPYFLFNLVTVHHLFPTTFYAKATYRHVGITSALHGGTLGSFIRASGRHIREQFAQVFFLFYKLQGFVFLLFPLGLLMFCRSFDRNAKRIGWLLPLALALMPVAMAIVAPPRSFANTGNRYYSVYIPLFSIIVALGWFVLLRRMRQRFLAFALLAVFLVVHTSSNLPAMVKMVARDVNTNTRLYVNMGKWIDENLEPDALLAVNDIGGVAYFCGRRRWSRPAISQWAAFSRVSPFDSA